MFTFLKRPLYVLVNKLRPDSSSAKIAEEKWIADFSSPEKSCFDIKTETAYDAYLLPPHAAPEKGAPGKIFSRRTEKDTGALALGLKKANCIAWVDAPERLYQDQVIEARLSLDNRGGYAAGGIMFRIVDEGTYYLALISSKGYFRMDAVRNNTPLPLVGWTEIPDLRARENGWGSSVTLTIIAYGSQFVFLVDDRWVAEIDEASILGGRVGLVLASYEAAVNGDVSGLAGTENKAYICQTRLERLSVDSRITAVEELYRKWNNSPDITAENRLILAETFAAMGSATAALSQMQKVWDRREESARSFTATYTDLRLKRELLLAARMARSLGQYSQADEYISACLEYRLDSREEQEALIEKARIFYAMEEFAKLKQFILAHNNKCDDNPVLCSLLGYACWNLKEYAAAAAAFEKAFELDKDNGVHACNAADCYETLGKKQKTFMCYLQGGKAFLAQENYGELGDLIPKLLNAGERNWGAHALSGKWAFGINDFDRAETELVLAEKLRLKMKNRPAADPAVSFLRGLLLIRKGLRQDASRFLEEAVRYEPSYGLFHFRLAENRYLHTGDARDPLVEKELKAALELMPDDGWVNNFAAQISLDTGDYTAAERYLEKASRTLGEVPAIRVNRAVLRYTQGSLEEALAILEADKRDDPEGLMANCAGNLLVRSGDLEKADSFYRTALSIAPENTGYLCNRASCLIELGYYEQADDLLAQARRTPEILELISHTAAKKGEYRRAESASVAALELAPDHLPSLFSLGWIYCNTGRFNDLRKLIGRLDKMSLNGSDARRRAELRQRYSENSVRVIKCADCGREWKVKRDCEPVTPIRLHAMPPDDFPAGSCPKCGKTYCIGCAKKRIDKSGRFICAKCRTNLKLTEEGLKKIVYDWAVKAVPGGRSLKGRRT
jgi:tetratricopeptide (TPR) repeat protein